MSRSKERLIRDHPHLNSDGGYDIIPSCGLCHPAPLTPAGTGPGLLPSADAPGGVTLQGPTGARYRGGESMGIATTIRWLRDHNEEFEAIELSSIVCRIAPEMKPIVAVAWLD